MADATTNPESVKRAVFSALLAVVLAVVVALCPLIGAQMSAQDCEATETVVIVCMMIAVVLTEIATLGALAASLWRNEASQPFLWLYLKTRQHSHIPPPKGRMAAFQTPLRI